MMRVRMDRGGDDCGWVGIGGGGGGGMGVGRGGGERGNRVWIG